MTTHITWNIFCTIPKVNGTNGSPQYITYLHKTNKDNQLQSSNIRIEVQKYCMRTNIQMQAAGDTSVCEFRENITKSGNFHTNTDFEEFMQPAKYWKTSMSKYYQSLYRSNMVNGMNNFSY